MDTGKRVVRVDARDEQSWNDAALAMPVERPRWRCWLYRSPAIVLGRSQWALSAALPPCTLPTIGRQAGGGAVLVGPWMLGVSLALPAADPRVAGETIADSYRWLGAAFVAALSSHGVAAESVPRAGTRAAPASLGWACFAGVAPWELVIGGRKIVGFAQRRSRNGVLIVAGALLSPVPWLLLCQALGRPAGDAGALAAMTIDASAARGHPLAGEVLADSLAAELG